MTLHGDINLLYLGFQYKCAVIIMYEWRSNDLMIQILKQFAMARSANTAVKEDDVTLAAEEILQFDDDNLRGEKFK